MIKKTIFVEGLMCLLKKIKGFAKIKYKVSIISHAKSGVIVCLAIVLFLFACRPIAEPMGIFAPSRLEHVLGQDGVAPIPFNENVVFWTFGDTIIGKWTTGENNKKMNIEEMLPNSLAFTQHLSKDSIEKLRFEYYREKGKIVPFIRLRSDENPQRIRLWALDGIRIKSRVYVFYAKIRIDEPGKPFAFTLLGTGLARWDVPDGWKIGMNVDFKRRDGIFDHNEPIFGGSVIEKDGFLYITGQKTLKDFKSYGYIARVPKDDIEKRNKYEFWSKQKKWDTNIENAMPLFGDVAGEWTLSYNQQKKSFVGVYCRLGKNEIALAEFSDFDSLESGCAKTVYTLPKLETKMNEINFYYSAKEIFSEGTDVYVIYINPIEYQPYLVRIRL